MALSNSTDHSNATAVSFLICEGHQEGFVFWMCVTSVSFVLGFPGAVAILMDMFQRVRKGAPLTPNDVFISNIAVLDGISLLSFLLQFSDMQRGSNFVFSIFLDFIHSFGSCGRPLFTTCICLDCYVAVVHPATYRARKSLTSRILMAVGVWTVTAAHGLYSAITHEQGLRIDLGSIIIFFALTLPVIGFCDFSILWTLKRSNPGGKDIHPLKKKALQVIINNMIVTFTSYFPPVITLSVFQFVSLDETIKRCLVVMPVMAITILGNTVSLLLHLNNLGKLDRLKCWKQK